MKIDSEGTASEISPSPFSPPYLGRIQGREYPAGEIGIYEGFPPPPPLSRLRSPVPEPKEAVQTKLSTSVNILLEGDPDPRKEAFSTDPWGLATVLGYTWLQLGPGNYAVPSRCARARFGRFTEPQRMIGDARARASRLCGDRFGAYR